MATASGSSATTDSGSSTDSEVAAEVPFSDFCKYVSIGIYICTRKGVNTVILPRPHHIIIMYSHNIPLVCSRESVLSVELIVRSQFWRNLLNSGEKLMIGSTHLGPPLYAHIYSCI